MKQLLLGLALVFTTPLFANCEDPMSQLDMNACAHQAYNQAVKTLNSYVEKLQKDETFDYTNKEFLKDALREWEEYREAECNFESDVIARGGSLQPLIFWTCMEELTLKQYDRVRSSIERY